MDQAICQIIAELLQPRRRAQTIIDLRNLDPPCAGNHEHSLVRRVVPEWEHRDIYDLLAAHASSIPNEQLYQAVHDLTVSEQVTLWYYRDDRADDDAQLEWYLVANYTVSIPWLEPGISGARHTQWHHWEMDDIIIYSFGDATRILHSMNRIDFCIHFFEDEVPNSPSYSKWWEMVIEYALTLPNDTTNTKLMQFCRCPALLEHDRNADPEYPTDTPAWVQQLPDLIRKNRSTYAIGCPTVAIANSNGHVFQTILPEILTRHRVSAAKSARSAEY